MKPSEKKIKTIIHHKNRSLHIQTIIGAIVDKLVNYTGPFCFFQVVHFAMALLVSWSNSAAVVSHRLLSTKNFSSWLSRLVLEDPDPSVRREISTALFRLCTTNQNIAPTLLSELIKFIEKAERMRPQRHEVITAVLVTLLMEFWRWVLKLFIGLLYCIFIGI